MVSVWVRPIALRAPWFCLWVRYNLDSISMVIKSLLSFVADHFHNLVTTYIYILGLLDSLVNESKSIKTILVLHINLVTAGARAWSLHRNKTEKTCLSAKWKERYGPPFNPTFHIQSTAEKQYLKKKKKKGLWVLNHFRLILTMKIEVKK